MAECTARDWMLVTAMVQAALERIAAEQASGGNQE